MSLCKYIPHKFQWDYFDSNQQVSTGKGKKKTLQKAGQIDLKSFPFLLKDGDILGVRLESENPDGNDDFQTEADLISKAEFDVRQKERKKKEAEARRLQATSARVKDAQGIKIHGLDDESPLYINQDDQED